MGREKVPSRMRKMRISSYACVKSHPGLCSIHSVVSNYSSSGQRSPDQTAHARSLIKAFAVRIYLKTRFRMVRPNYVKMIVQIGKYSKALPWGCLFQCSPEIFLNFPLFPKVKMLIFYAPCSQKLPLFSCSPHF